MKFKNIKVWIIAASIGITAATSCNKALDVLPTDRLDVSQNYRDVYDANAAIFGLYGKFQGLAKQYIILNELRADLMQATDNADKYLKQISTHNVTSDNPYINPKPFYEVILNCNDVIKNFDIMLRDKKIKQAEYDQRYSDVVALRTFVYLQLGIHFGTIPYVTDALEDINAVKDASKYPRLSLTINSGNSSLLEQLIKDMEALPFKDIYPTAATTIVTVDGISTYKSFIHKRVLLGDLYLWKGNYPVAASYYKSLMDTYLNDGNINLVLDPYKVRYGAGGSDVAIGYSRGQDETSLLNSNTQGWRSMFARPQDAVFNWEAIWVMYFNSNFLPKNPFIEMFDNTGGSYLLKPSQAAIDNWTSQTQTNGFPYDARGILTWKNLNGQRVIVKPLYNYLNETTLIPINTLQANGRWYIQRASTVHLRFAEAANQDKHNKLAWAFINRGINFTYDPAPPSSQSGDNRDVSTLQNTLTDPNPTYQFDGRYGTYPYFRGAWNRNVGLRGRAALQSVPVTSPTDSTRQIEDMAINESALETAYEGNRWPDLLRVAIRRNDVTFLSNKIEAKFTKESVPGGAGVKSRLSSIEKCFLPFNWN